MQVTPNNLYGLRSRLTYELTFADYCDVIKASNHIRDKITRL